MARPERLTAERQERFLQAIRAGSFPEVAARYAGISPASYYRYMAGKTPEHAAFRDAVQQALTELEIRLVGLIAREAGKTPRWALALLERRFGTRWGRHALAEAVDPEAGPERPNPADELINLDRVSIELIVPRLLAASQRLRVAGTESQVDLSRFEERRPASDPGEEP